MTAFARAEQHTPLGNLTMEARSVNNRYLDLGLKLDDSLKRLEPVLRERIGARIRRGRVELSMRLDGAADALEIARLNRPLLERLRRLQDSVRRVMPDAAPLSAYRILTWPGAVEGGDTDDDAVDRLVLPIFDGLLDELVAGRRREGKELGGLIRRRIGEARALVEELRSKLPEIRRAARQRLETRIAEIVREVDSERLEQEVALLLNKSDVEEELDRLAIHCGEVLSVLKQDRPIGRKLDFLMQELNRESNTLGAKAAHLDVTNAAVELKVLIEQMREQVQNVE